MNNHKKRHHITIAFLIDSLFDDYQITLWKSTMEACRASGINFISFLGGILWFKHFFQGNRNKIYDLISNERIDGIIVCSTTFFYNVSGREMVEYYRSKFGSIPLVSIGVHLKGIPSIVIDNKQGMKSLLSHLIEFHGYKKIAFISGPKMNTDATERLSAYKEMYASHDIPFDKDNVIDGEFTIASGRKAARHIIERKNSHYDAIAASNDLMAVGIMSELCEKDYRIPEDIPVTGFDNSSILYSYDPPLTTVNQPIVEMGEKAVGMIFELIRGKQVDPITILPTFPVIRYSCGCRMTYIEPTEQDKLGAPGQYNSGEQIVSYYSGKFSEDKQIISHSSAIEKELFKNLEEKIKQSIISSAHSLFQRSLGKIIHQIIIKGVKFVDYISSINALFTSLKLTMDNKYVNRIEQVQAECIKILFNTEEYIQTRMQMEVQKNKTSIYRFTQRLSTSITREYLLRAFEEELPNLGIRNFFIFRYTDNKGKKNTMASLDFSFSLDNLFTIDRRIKEFPANRLFPGIIRDDIKTFNIVVYPLFFHSEDLGYFICNIGNTDSTIYEIIHGQLSGAIKSTEMMDQLKKHAHELEKTVKKRTEKLRKITNELKQANKKLKELTITDELTGAYNRRYFDKQLQREWARSARNMGQLSLIFIDLDHFKTINDTYGHQAGDTCLKQLVSIIKQKIRRSADIVCRYGGEEFAVILSLTKKEDTLFLAEVIRKTVEKAQFHHKDTDIRLTISIGVSSIIPTHDQKYKHLIAMADKALYKAKECGRNIVAYAE